MKLNIIRYCMLLLGAMLMLVSCNESVDADKYNRVSKELLPTFATQSDSLSFDRVKLKATITLNGDENIMESGFFVSANDEFPEVATSIINAEQHDLEIEKWVDKLVGSTTYYYKAYTYSENGFAFSEVKSITTDEPPVFEDTYLFGTYNQIDYSIRYGTINGEESGYWDEYGYMTIKQVENTYNQIEVYNYWGYGRIIIGVVDFESKTIEFMPQEIAASEGYGSIKIYKWSMLDGNMQIHLEEPVVATYSEDGVIEVDMWGAFAYYNNGYMPFDACSTTELIKKEE
ncbi:hypothetical protein KDU71_00930 [Carboxylicivirga sediminis]|uniref:Uncharacterized protein n=1 Tax=Carboxylicivirga sediminis TaxID=2006564 RepID=A0A941F2E1_9BACT|nr:hypothetical protein [Carboxylicivirga sediminis]MBR8534110.1 hypothetical protein [Carboxylicivirga sediminis]